MTRLTEIVFFVLIAAMAAAAFFITIWVLYGLFCMLGSAL